MKQVAVPSGTAPEATSDSIIIAELQKLQDYRNKIADENQKYIDAHPEMRILIDEFVSAAIQAKPNDLVKFGSFFFTHWKKNGTVGPCPIVIAGPSGVGKTTLINKLIAKFPNLFGFCVSHTTRNQRQGEENGIHFNFVSKEEFEEMIEKKQFIEHTKLHMNYYGTSIQSIEKVRCQNKICLIDIDIAGVNVIKNSSLDFKSLFIVAPSLEELERRLVARKTDTPDKIKQKLEAAGREIAYSQVEGNFDRVLANVNLETCFAELVHLLQGWYPDLDLFLD